ncbi:pyridoxal kinase-like [Octopus sinensis]|uniref:pyridoxal kinase n=1 Tax=Octopus sinensis TaxID=2607531 RepID=A0A6P7U057_9MOLL|nr:pyridoxal kinase-like [Octopus sinensis]
MPAKLLSIQSHVVSGVVGNKAATLPIKMMGITVDEIHTVQFISGKVSGITLSGHELKDIYEALTVNKLSDYSHLLTGYILNRTLRYVPEELLETYIKHILPLADVITPNHFEAE